MTYKLTKPLTCVIQSQLLFYANWAQVTRERNLSPDLHDNQGYCAYRACKAHHNDPPPIAHEVCLKH